jgi:hypothetical protein
VRYVLSIATCNTARRVRSGAATVIWIYLLVRVRPD